MSECYDVIIVGGGIVGATLACALADAGLSIALVHDHVVPPADGKGDISPRTCALNIAAQRIFIALDVWDHMTKRRAYPFRYMHVEDAQGHAVIHFDSAEVGCDALGYIVENAVILAALWERARTLPLTLFCPARIAALGVDAEQARVRLDDGRSLCAKLVVGADGSASNVRQLAGINSHVRPYAQCALTATVKPEFHHRHTAWQRFLPTGPLALLPLSDGYCSLVWTTAPEHAESLSIMDTKEFLDALEQASGGVLGAMQTTGPRLSHALQRVQASRYVGARVALVGDAAHVIHPLAGQGVNLGLLDAATLAECVIAAHVRGRDHGASALLRRYERWRGGENALMQAAVHSLQRLFDQRSDAVRAIRNTGLTAVDKLPPFKHLLMRRAMGLSGELPLLARK